MSDQLGIPPKVTEVSLSYQEVLNSKTLTNNAMTEERAALRDFIQRPTDKTHADYHCARIAAIEELQDQAKAVYRHMAALANAH